MQRLAAAERLASAGRKRRLRRAATWYQILEALHKVARLSNATLLAPKTGAEMELATIEMH
jgi:hypothetical protein